MAEETSSDSEAESMADHPPPPYPPDSPKTATTVAMTLFQCHDIECCRKYRLRMTYEELTEHLRDVHKQFTPVPDETSHRAEKTSIREAPNHEGDERPRVAKGHVPSSIKLPGQAYVQSPHRDETQNFGDRREARENVQKTGIVMSDHHQPETFDRTVSRQHGERQAHVVRADQVVPLSDEKSHDSCRNLRPPVPIQSTDSLPGSSARLSAGSKLFGSEEQASQESTTHNVRTSRQNDNSSAAPVPTQSFPVRLSPRTAQLATVRDEGGAGSYNTLNAEVLHESAPEKNPFKPATDLSLTQGEILFTQVGQSRGNEPPQSKPAATEPRQSDGRARAANTVDRSKHPNSRPQPRRGPNGNGSEDEDRDPKRPRTQIADAEEAAERRVICPFHRRNPSHRVVSSACLGPGFEKFQHLRTHLLQHHSGALTCRRCFKWFRQESELTDHQRGDVLCEMVDMEHYCIVNKAKMDAVQVKIRQADARTIGAKWMVLYRELFPKDTNYIPSPWRDLDMKERVKDYAFYANFRILEHAGASDFFRIRSSGLSNTQKASLFGDMCKLLEVFLCNTSNDYVALNMAQERPLTRSELSGQENHPLHTIPANEATNSIHDAPSFGTRYGLPQSGNPVLPATVEIGPTPDGSSYVDMHARQPVVTYADIRNDSHQNTAPTRTTLSPENALSNFSMHSGDYTNDPLHPYVSSVGWNHAHEADFQTLVNLSYPGGGPAILNRYDPNID